MSGRDNSPVPAGSDASTFLAVVPAYNEHGSIAGVVRSLRQYAPRFDVVVIDDGSSDSTWAEAMAAGATAVRLPFNLGIGGAVQTGFIYAEEHGYDVMAQVDGDGQHNAAELAKLVAALEMQAGVDVVCGSRFLSPEHRYPAPFSRKTGINLFAFSLSRILRQPVSDPTSGFRVFNRRAIKLFARDYPRDYPEVEALLLLHANRLRFTEVAVRMNPRSSGRSSITTARSVYYMIKVSLALLVGLLRRKRADEFGELTPLGNGGM